MGGITNYASVSTVLPSLLQWVAARPGEKEDEITPKTLSVDGMLLEAKKNDDRKIILHGNKELTQAELLNLVQGTLVHLTKVQDLGAVNKSLDILQRRWKLLSQSTVTMPRHFYPKMARDYTLWAVQHVFWNFLAIILSLGLMLKVYNDGKMILQKEKTQQALIVAAKAELQANAALYKQVKDKVSKKFMEAQEVLMQEMESVASALQKPSNILFPVVTKAQMDNIQFSKSFFTEAAKLAVIPKAKEVPLTDLTKWSDRVKKRLPAQIDDEGEKRDTAMMLRKFNKVIKNPKFLTRAYSGLDAVEYRGSSLNSETELPEFINVMRHLVHYFRLKEKELNENVKKLSADQLKEAKEAFEVLLNDTLHLRLGIDFLHCSDRIVESCERIYFGMIAADPQEQKDLYAMKNLVVNKLMVMRMDLFNSIVSVVVWEALNKNNPAKNRTDPHQVCTAKYYRTYFAKKYGLGDPKQKQSRWEGYAIQGHEKEIEKRFNAQHTPKLVFESMHGALNAGKISTESLFYWFAGAYKALAKDLLDADGRWKRESAYIFLKDNGLMV